MPGHPQQQDIGPGPASDADVAAFVARWQRSGAAERANFQPFLLELTDLLAVPRPQPAQGNKAADSYCFERPVTALYGDGSSSTRFVDLYRQDAFVMEAKQGSGGHGADQGAMALLRDPALAPRRGTARRGTDGWTRAMQAARGQAEGYARNLRDEGQAWVPFLIVVDVGHTIDLYAEFTRSGRTYVPFPDARSYRIGLEDLAQPETRTVLRSLWLAPMALDPASRAAMVTRAVAATLAALARSYEQAGHGSEQVSAFLMKMLFTMFAEDIGLIPHGKFTDLLRSLRDDRAAFVPLLTSLWRTMDAGGYSSELRADLVRFNGDLFADAQALPVTDAQLELLIQAAERDWRDVEPAIFGTLLERALDARERHKLGAHYTPRAYVERLVEPTIMQPLRTEWNAVRLAALKQVADGNRKAARATVRDFHTRLCKIKVLDPACGSGNFLYVALEQMKRLEGEILAFQEEIGERVMTLEQLSGHVLDPHNFLGIEVNGRAAGIAEMVLWIGYLQWHFRTRGKSAKPPIPVLKRYHNIERRDALLTWKRTEIVRDDQGRPITRWDGHTTRAHPVTGEAVPDDAARVEQVRYISPGVATWPTADYIIGNPPFIGGKDLRAEFGDGYLEALWSQYDLPQSADFVMYWWHKAAAATRKGRAKRFGFITTNSLPQAFSSRVVKTELEAKPPLSLVFAIPDHPWSTAPGSAAVRVAMTVGQKGKARGLLMQTVSEAKAEGDMPQVEYREDLGAIHSNLRLGADLTSAQELRANDRLCSPGVKLHGSGFIVTPEQAVALGLGSVDGLDRHIRAYRNGRDMASRPRGVMVIDLFGLTESEVRERFPSVYQRILERVKPERDQNNRAAYRDLWWVFGEPRRDLRPALAGLKRFITTVETSKHRWFTFLSGDTLPDNKLVNIGLNDGYHLAVLSSRIHCHWAVSLGGRLGVGNDPVYVKSRCFDAFPFPDDLPDSLTRRLRDLGERLDAHRKDRIAEHPDLTMTGLYNALEALRAADRGETGGLTAKERDIHEKGLVTILQQIHDEIDAATAAAYGWPADLHDDDILTRLVDLNRERVTEEAQGAVRWLRPDYQNPEGTRAAVQDRMALAESAVPAAEKIKLPSDLPGRVSMVRDVLITLGQPATTDQVAAHFTRARRKDVADILDTLVAFGQARALGKGRYAA